MGASGRVRSRMSEYVERARNEGNMSKGREARGVHTYVERAGSKGSIFKGREKGGAMMKR